ncbi:hypothetical protein [Azohydromonas caseinilytica]|uniref:Uncharacterized protein n=1 Tax=Azohydromonas caseinilytica TaxID=2728836 RepID=A0A848F6W6_9BURK|nr:hypothetical protein [Azohydromonas caseinilytica]NML15102.1 hypothetical protein [Azohydromonas caseinilytica]
MSVTDIPESGAIPYALGQPSIVRIPIPGTNGLCIEFRARGWTPKGGSTSTIFFQDISGKRHLRLDYGYNIAAKTVDYHWNQVKTHTQFGIANHASAGRTGQIAFQAAKYFRHVGRVLVVAGVAIDVVSVVRADKPLRRASEAVAGWAAAWVGCKAIGTAGAGLGSLASPLGMAAVGVSGCVIGGAVGYYSGAQLAGRVYDWAEDTNFFAVPEVLRP